MTSPPRVHLIGHSGCGKTSFATELVRALTRRGLRVGTIKHSSHVHELDKVGKDSHRLREAGGDPAAVIASSMAAIFLPQREGRDVHAEVLRLFSGCDLVLAEGRHHAPEEASSADVMWIEVYRRACAEPPLFEALESISALVGEGAKQGIPCFTIDDAEGVAELVVGRLGLRR